MVYGHAHELLCIITNCEQAGFPHDVPDVSIPVRLCVEHEYMKDQEDEGHDHE